MKKRNRKIGMLLGMSALIAIHSAMVSVPARAAETGTEVQLTETQESEETEAVLSETQIEETEAEEVRSEIFAGSSVSYLDESDTEGLDAQVLSYARYEIMARKGILFDSEELNAYFTSQNWYFGFIPESTADDSMFTECELANMRLLQAAEKAASADGSGYALDQPGWTSDAVLVFRGAAPETAEEEETEAVTEEAATEAVTEEAATEAAAEEAATEAATEEAAAEAATEETAIEAVTEEAAAEAAAEEAATEAATEEAAAEAVTEEDVTEADMEEAMAESAAEEAAEAAAETAAAPLVPRQAAVPAGALAEGFVQAGDIANIDFRGSVDGAAVSGAEAENFNVMIGSGTLGPEMEQGLLGAAVGEVITIPVSYPADYRFAALAGKEVVYEVVVNYIQRFSQTAPQTETETQAAGTEPYVTETETPETVTQLTEAETKTAETEVQAVETEMQTETQAAETEAQTETQAAETEAQTETQAVETETQAAETETQAAETETQTEETEAQTAAAEPVAEADTEIYGMLAETVYEEESVKFRMPSGAYLTSVEPRSAAGLAGLLAGDVITGIDRASVNSAEFLNMLLSSYAEGEEAVIRYQRLDGGSYKEYIAKMKLLKEVDEEDMQTQAAAPETDQIQPDTSQHAEGPEISQGNTQQHAEGPEISQGNTQQHAEGPEIPQGSTQQNVQRPQTTGGNSGGMQRPQSGPTVLDEYIFPDVDSRYLTDEEVNRLSLQQVCYAKNEVYAIHGRQFVSVELQQYFGSKSWYYGFVAPADFTDTVFNDFERANIQKLVNRENALSGGAGYQLDQPGYDINLAGTASLKR